MDEIRYPIKIIYAEDNPTDIDLTRLAFQDLRDKFEFEFVLMGKELINKVNEEKYDLILLDNNLPDLEGVDLIPKLIDLGVKAPIILITGIGDEELVLKAIKFGASDYISKTGDYLDKLPDYLLRVYVISKKLKRE